MAQIFSALLILPHALSCGLVTSCPLAVLPLPGVLRLQGGGLGLHSLSPHAQKCSGSPRACPSPLVLCSFLSMRPRPGCEGQLPPWDSIKQGRDHHCMYTENSRCLPTWDRTLHVRWGYQVSKTCVTYTAKPDPITKSHKMEIKRKTSLALCK